MYLYTIYIYIYSTRSLTYECTYVFYTIIDRLKKKKKILFSRQRATAVTADCSLVCSQNIYII